MSFWVDPVASAAPDFENTTRKAVFKYELFVTWLSHKIPDGLIDEILENYDQFFFLLKMNLQWNQIKAL